MTHIRPAIDADGEALARIYAQYVVDSPVSFELVAPDADEMRRRLRAVRESGPWLVCEESGSSGAIGAAPEVVGYAYAARHHQRAAYRWSADATVYLDGRHHRRGLGSALYRALFGILRAQGYRAVHACISLPNAASVGLHERLGFRQVALFPKVGWKLGRWIDIGWWQLEIGAREAPPVELTSVDEALRASLPLLVPRPRSGDGC